jgi:hypothetical protein
MMRGPALVLGVLGSIAVVNTSQDAWAVRCDELNDNLVINCEVSPPAGGESYWSHNGSSFRLIVQNEERQFVYLEPRPGLKKIGVKPGAVVFTGIRDRDTYMGTAYVFSSHCGPIGFEVLGRVSLDDRHVKIRGYAPAVDAQCIQRIYSDVIWAFDYVDGTE